MDNRGMRLLVGTAVLAGLFLAVSAFEVWKWTTDQIEEVNDRQARLLLAFNNHIQEYAKTEVEPFARQRSKPGEFFPEVMSPTFMARKILDGVQVHLPAYLVKFSDTNPRDLVNLASLEEEKLLERFRQDPSLQELTGKIRIDGTQYYFRARPRRVEASCLPCHGRPEDAPVMLVASFGATRGFGKSVGDLWLDLVAVTDEEITAEVAAKVHGRLLRVVIYLGVLFAGLGFLAWGYVGERREIELRMKESRDFLQTVIDTIPDPVLVIDRNLKILHGNRSQAAALADGTQMAGSMCYQVAHHRDTPCCGANEPCPIEAVLETKSPVVVEHQHQDSQGQTHFIEVSVAPVFDRNREVVQFVEFCHDITKRRRAEQAAQRSRRDWEDCFDSIGDMITIHDQDFNIIQANLAAVLGLKIPLLGTATKKCYQYFHGSDAPPESCPGIECLRTKETTSVELFEPYLGRYLEVFTFPRIDEKGDVVGMVHITRDIGEKKRLAEERSRLQEQILQSQKLESLGILTGGIAHDFNNILTAIQGFSELALLDVAPGSELETSIREIMVSTRRATDLCSQLLSYAGRGHFVAQPLDLRELVEETLGMVKGTIPAHVEVRFHFGEAVPAIQGDPVQLRQAIINLVVNATEALRDRPGSITLRTGTLDGTTEFLAGTIHDPKLKPGPLAFFEVADTGPGVPPEVLGRIFDPFFSTKGGGRGLGLSAVMGIIRSHSGGVRITSELGLGTTVLAFFPAGLPGALPAPKPPVKVDHPQAVMVIDDEETSLAIAREILERGGWTPIVVSDPKEATETFRRLKKEIVCVILDLLLPNGAGTQLLRELRGLKGEVRVILTGDRPEGEMRTRPISWDRAVYLQKPFAAEALGAAVREVVAGDPSSKKG